METFFLVLATFGRFAFWQHLHLGKYCVLATFWIWQHLHFSNIISFKSIKKNNSCILVKFVILEYFGFTIFVILQHWKLWKHWQLGIICILAKNLVLPTKEFFQHLCFGDIFNLAIFALFSTPDFYLKGVG